MTAHRRTASDVKLEINQAIDLTDNDDGSPGGATDETDDIDLIDEDEDEFLNHPLVPNDSYRGYYPTQPPGLPPPPYDSQEGEAYRLVADDEEDGSSPLEAMEAENGTNQNGGPLNSYRYPRSKRSRSGNPYPRELKKFIAGAVFMIINFVATTVALSVTHERVPRYDPLPDIILDFFRYQHWALTASECLLSVQCATAFLICIFHKHRFIVLRRLFLLLGLLYGYRAVTMFVTVLPIANPEYQCDPKLSDEGKVLSVKIVLMRAIKIISGFGLTMNGNHVYCGDFIYSGHTMTFVLAYLVMLEYTSKRLYVLHWVAWINAITGVALLLMARGHYSIDVIVAYWISTRLWYLYHSMACNSQLKQASPTNYFTRIWWWTFMRWFEENVKTGPIPNGFNLPLPKALCKSLRTKSRTLVNETSRLTRNRQRKYKEEA